MADTMERTHTMLDLDETEIQRRVNLLKRLRSMLEVQREKFRNYLSVLNKQEQSIQNGDMRALEAQAAVEQQMVREILAVQKTIQPLDEMYKKAYPGRKAEITQLQDSLENLQQQVLLHNQLNRDKLSKQRDELKKKIESLRIPKGRKSVYAKTPAPSMVDISC